MDVRKLKDRALEEMSKRRFGKAADIYAQLCEADPRDLQMQQRQADALRAAGRNDEAKGVYGDLAQAYAKDGQLLKAIAVNKVVLEIDPNHTATQTRLAALYARRTPSKSNPVVLIPLVNVVSEAPPSAEPKARDDASMVDFLSEPSTPEAALDDFLSAADSPSESELEVFVEPPMPAQVVPSDEPEQAAEDAPILDFSIDIEGDEPLFADEIKIEAGLDLQALDPATMETLSRLPESPLFESLDADAFMDLLNRCERRTFAPGEVLIQQGDPARSFFVLNQGELKVVQTPADGQAPVQLALLHSGDFFGEMALVSGGPRGASVIAVTEGEALEFPGQVLRDLVSDHAEAFAALNRFTRARLLQNTMATSPLFRPFDRAQRKLLIARFVIRDVEPGTQVLVEGQPSDGLYVVMLGHFRVERGGQPLALLTAGDVFGEMSLLTRTNAGATVVSEGPGRLLRLPRKIFDELILTHPQVLELVSTLADQRQAINDDLTSGKLASDRDGLILM